jgi:hypothetical protein
MATNLPFTPLQASATVGKTVKLTTNGAASVAGTLDCTGFWANSILVTNGGTSAAGGDPGTGVVAFVRMSPEPQASIVATAADVPILPGQSRIFQNPVAQGKTGLAVLSSGTTNVDVLFTPGEGGS